MYFSKVQLKANVSPTELFYSTLPKRGGEQTYKAHQQIWKLMEGVEKRDFLYRLHQDGPAGMFYLVSMRQPVDKQGYWHVATKPYQPDLTPGTRLSFVLRANPVVTRHIPDPSGPSSHRRHDVVMNAKKKLTEAGTPREQWPPSHVMVHEQGMNWLAKRGQKHGFALDENLMRVDGYQKQKFWRPKGNGDVFITTLDFTGVLTVTDKEAFTQALFQGIGPAKGFGCGMLLVKPFR